MTLTEKNRAVCEMLGIVHTVHPIGQAGYGCSCGFNSNFPSVMFDHIQNSIPDFCADPVSLLREMMKRGDWLGDYGFRETFHEDDDGDACTPEQRMAELLTDQTGKLLEAAWEFLKGREKYNAGDILVFEKKILDKTK
jgi:hypothetical protein